MPESLASSQPSWGRKLNPNSSVLVAGDQAVVVEKADDQTLTFSTYALADGTPGNSFTVESPYPDSSQGSSLQGVLSPTTIWVHFADSYSGGKATIAVYDLTTGDAVDELSGDHSTYALVDRESGQVAPVRDDTTRLRAVMHPGGIARARAELETLVALSPDGKVVSKTDDDASTLLVGGKPRALVQVSEKHALLSGESVQAGGFVTEVRLLDTTDLSLVDSWSCRGPGGGLNFSPGMEWVASGPLRIDLVAQEASECLPEGTGVVDIGSDGETLVGSRETGVLQLFEPGATTSEEDLGSEGLSILALTPEVAVVKDGAYLVGLPRSG